MGLTYSFISSLQLNRQLSVSSKNLSGSLEKLSTGYRINKAADDAAGLSISEKLKTQITGYEQSIRNSQDAYSLLTVAEGGSSIVTENLQRIRELTVQAANDTLGTSERAAISTEINQRLTDINRIADTTKFNNINLLNNQIPSNMKIQIGPNSGDAMDIQSALGNIRTTAIGLTAAGSVNITTATGATAFLTKVDTAISNVTSKRSNIGAFQNRLDSVIDSLSVTSMNVASANSRIRDTDIASETQRFVRSQLVQQFTTSLLSQANSSASSTTLGLLNSVLR